MANELVFHYPTGATLYVLLHDAAGQIWNGSAFAAPGSANWADYDIAMTEVATETGIYRATMPAVAAGSYGFVVRLQAGANPAVTDITVGYGSLLWDGSAVLTPAAAGAAMTLADDAITASKFDESTAFPLAAADTGATQIARTGADADTLKTLSDQIDSVSAAIGAIGTGTGTALTEQQVADAVNNLAPAGGSGAAGSMRAKIEDILEDTSTTLPATLNALPAAIEQYLASYHGAGFWDGSQDAPNVYARTYYLPDNTGHPIGDCLVWVTTDVDGTNIVQKGITDDFGNVTIYLQAGLYYIWRRKAGMSFSNPDSITVVAP